MDTIVAPASTGHLPDTLTYSGERSAYQTTIQVATYTEDTLNRFELIDMAQLTTQPLKENTQIWIAVTGFSNAVLIVELAKYFHLHPLVIEDILSMRQRTKIDYFHDYLYVVARLQTAPKETQQLSFILLKNCLISFQEIPSPHFSLLNQRLDLVDSRLHTSGVDYLFYSLLDRLVDTQLHLVDLNEEVIEALEETIVENAKPLSLPKFYKLKRQTMQLRKQLQPLRDALSLLTKSDTPFITPNTTVYLRDVYDHALRLNDSLESQRDMLSTLLEIHLSSVNNRMNQTMKVLTMFAAIFIPLSFIASLFGMNFTYMPQLQWHYGYYATLGLMAALTAGLLVWFRHKKWW